MSVANGRGQLLKGGEGCFSVSCGKGREGAQWNKKHVCLYTSTVCVYVRELPLCCFSFIAFMSVL